MTAPEPEAPPASSPKPPRYRRGLRYGVELRLHRWWGGRWRHPAHRSGLADQRTHDADENAQTRPSADQGADLRTVWAVEVYTPAHAEGLRRAFERFGWEAGDRPFGTTPGRWLRQMRESRGSTGSYNLGVIRRPDGPRLMGAFVRSGPVPDFAEVVTLWLHQVSPAVAMVVAGFQLSPEQATVLEEELRRDRRSTALPVRRGYSISRPTTQKREGVSRARRAIRGSINAWFRATLPGAFSAAGATLPSCELLVLSPGETAGGRGGLVDLLGVNRSPGNYRPTGWPGAELRFLETEDASPTIQLCLLIETAALAALDMEGYGSDRLAFPLRAERPAGALLQQAAALGLLEVNERRLSRIRDLGLRARGDAVRRLRELETLTRESFDLTSVARDLQGLDGEWDDDGVRWTIPGDGERDADLGATWSTWIVQRAQALIDLDGVLKALILQHGNLLATRQNLRLQKSVWVLAIVTGILTFITAVGPAADAYTAAREWVQSRTNEVPALGVEPAPPPADNVRAAASGHAGRPQ